MRLASRLLVVLGLVVLGLGGLGTACANYDPCFQPQSVISDLRLLAVRTDPPEVIFDGRQIPPLRVRALLGSGGGGFAQVELQGSVCAPNPDGTCASPSSYAGGSSGALGEVSFSLVPPFDLLAAALASDPLRGYGGIRVQLKLAASGDGTTTSAEKLLLYSPTRPGYVPNHGFEIDSIDLLEKGQLVANSTTAGEFSLVVGKTYGLRPHLAPAEGELTAAEEYDVTDLAGNRQHLREHITYSFYATPHLIFGDLSTLGGNIIGSYVAGADTASEPEPGAPGPPEGLVRLTPVSATTGALYVVARDGRGAEAFREVPLGAPDQRCCADSCPPYGRGCPALEFDCR